MLRAGLELIAIAQAGFEFSVIPLPLVSKRNDSKCVPPHPTNTALLFACISAHVTNTIPAVLCFFSYGFSLVIIVGLSVSIGFAGKELRNGQARGGTLAINLKQTVSSPKLHTN